MFPSSSLIAAASQLNFTSLYVCCPASPFTSVDTKYFTPSSVLSAALYTAVTPSSHVPAWLTILASTVTALSSVLLIESRFALLVALSSDESKQSSLSILSAQDSHVRFWNVTVE